ncbi:MAG: selenocysteine-specific translation elongation factor [Deltaproteobacteria bacterium]|jgi:selenocysteine-specific elongation factor|nr:selenocysteine-specific translation elongation factor [Deltaproteobacteria bacterium]
MPAEHQRPPLILGTAGHIDHGKTTLIQALTGVDTDRLPEEKKRGITIELGFAPLDLGEGLRLGVVDVPGHEGLVRTMVAGATGIDLVLLVVAADEGVMPQTREHLAICDLLGLEIGVVALTKTDLADDETRELAGEEVRELVEETCLAGAAVIQVSAQTGTGIPELRSALESAAAEARARTPREGPPRLWVDRRFEMRGFGSVVTGTLIGSPLRVGDTVELQPSGRTGRIRGLQSFGETCSEVRAGARCAVNVQNVPLAELNRGLLITAEGALLRTDRFDAELSWLPSAPAFGNDPSSVELLCGTAERRARVAPIGTESIAPGATGLARVHVDGEPLALLPGDRFVLRGFQRGDTGGATLGGGRVLDVAPPQRRRQDAELARELQLLAGNDPASGLRARVLRAGFAGAPVARLALETGLPQERVRALLTDSGEEVLPLGRELWLGKASARELEGRLLSALRAFHDEHPLEPGMPRATLRGALPENVPVAAFEQLIEGLAGEGRIEVEEKVLRAADFAPRLSEREESIAARLRSAAKGAGLEPPTVADWSAELDLPERVLRPILGHLERDGSLVRAPGELWFDKGAIDELRERVIAHLTEEGELPTATYKDMIGTSRKYAVPLMELFDSEHLTMRKGEVRVLRRRPAGR